MTADGSASAGSSSKARAYSPATVAQAPVPQGEQWDAKLEFFDPCEQMTREVDLTDDGVDHFRGEDDEIMGRTKTEKDEVKAQFKYSRRFVPIMDLAPLVANWV